MLGRGRETRKSSDQNPFIPLIFKVLTTPDSFLCTVPSAEGSYNIKTFISFKTCEEIPYRLDAKDLLVTKDPVQSHLILVPAQPIPQ
jgi:hypothetical protein